MLGQRYRLLASARAALEAGRGAASSTLFLFPLHSLLFKRRPRPHPRRCQRGRLPRLSPSPRTRSAARGPGGSFSRPTANSRNRRGRRKRTRRREERTGNGGLTFLLGPGRVKEHRQGEAQHGCPPAAALREGGAGRRLPPRRHRAAAAGAGPPRLRPGRGARAEELGEGRGGAQRGGAGRGGAGGRRSAAWARAYTRPRGAGPRRGGAILSVGNTPLPLLTGSEPRLALFFLRVCLFFPYCCYFCCDSVFCASSSCPRCW